MPLGGIRQYGIATGAMKKNPSLSYSSGRQYLDQNFKLMFVYPILFEEKTSKAQASRGERLENYENIIRDFISASFLKEIFISNTIDVVSMASQIRPLRDEEGDRVDTTNLVGDVLSGQAEMQRRYIDQNYRLDIEQQMRRKISSLKNLLRIDPQTSVLNPQVDMILLQNLVEVPVITGTKPFKISTAEMFQVLVAAIALKKPLNSIENIRFIFRILRETLPKDFWKLLNNLAPPQPADRRSWLDRLHVWQKEQINRPVSGKNSSDKNVPSVSEHTASNIQNYLRQRFSQTELFFKMMVDPNLLRTQTGLDVSTGQMAGVVTKINPERNVILSNMENRIMQEFSSTGNAALRSFANIYFPQGSNLDYVQEHRNFLRVIHEELHDIIRGNLYACIESSLSQHSHAGIEQQAKRLKISCEDSISVAQRKLAEFSASLNRYSLNGTSFTIREYSDFLSHFEGIASEATGYKANLESALDDILDCGAAFNSIRNVIDQELSKLFAKYFSNIDDVDAPPTIRVVAGAVGYNTGPYEKSKVQGYMLEARRSLNEFYQFLFFAHFSKAFCKLVNIIDVEVKTAQTDVTEWPNYTLVVPIEIIQALHVTMLSKGWQELTKAAIGQYPVVERLTDQNVKRVIKYLVSRLDVPNLIVIDRKKNQIFTKLMYHSQVVKMNLQTLNTFVKEMENIRASNAQ